MEDKIQIPEWIFKTAAGLAAVFVMLAVATWLMSPASIAEREADAAPPISDRPRLLVFESATCGWCVRFRKDAAPAYEISRFDTLAPLHYIDIKDQKRSGYRLKSWISATPTFVLVDTSGTEVARLRGYPGSASRFLPEVETMLEKLASAQ